MISVKGKTIGIPQALYFYLFFPIWNTFLEEIGAEVVVSGNTTKAMVDAGVRETVTDACIPIKVFQGHVVSLAKRTDYLFVPRLLVKENGTFCPKFLGLPDMIRYSSPDLPPVIGPRLDCRASPYALWKTCCQLGGFFDVSRIQIYRAYRQVRRQSAHFNDLLKQRYTPGEIFESQYNGTSLPELPKRPSLRLGLIGYPYVVNDEYLNMGLVGKLREMNIDIITPEMVPISKLQRYNNRFRKNIFWHFSDLMVRSAYYLLDQANQIDGLIHITAFGCGPDFMVNKLIELEAKRKQTVPFLTLMIDEQSGEAGIMTRLEAFIEMIIRRKEQLLGGR